MDLSHPLRITLSQVIIDRNDTNALSCQCIQIGRQRGNQCLTFTGTHLGDTSLMQHDTTDQLHTEMLHIQDTLTCFTYGCKCFRKQTV